MFLEALVLLECCLALELGIYARWVLAGFPPRLRPSFNLTIPS